MVDSDNSTNHGISMRNVQTALVFAALLLFLANLALMSGLSKEVQDFGTALAGLEGGSGNSQAPAEPEKPEVGMISITDSSCTDCFDIGKLAEAVKNSNFKIVSEKSLDYKSAEAQGLIEKYGIEAVPTIILTGEASEDAAFKSSWDSIGSTESDGALVLRKKYPVYLDLATEQYGGRVGLILLVDSNCTRCSEPLSAQQLSSAGITVSGEETIEAGSARGKELIEKYAVEKLPTAILSSEISAYEDIAKSLESTGSFEQDGSFVLRTIQPIYLDMATGKEVGDTSVIYLSDENCAECYDVNAHKKVLEDNFGLVITSESHIDVATRDGAKLVLDYNITKAPTIIIRGDVSAYSLLSSVWPQVGTVESDGSYVFRNLNALGSVVYMDLETGTVVDTAAGVADTTTGAADTTMEEMH